MGSAIAVAAIGLRLLRAAGATAFATREPVSWTVERPALRHIGGSLLFGAGWSIAATCPGPVAVMIGEGRFGGLSSPPASSPASCSSVRSLRRLGARDSSRKQQARPACRGDDDDLQALLLLRHRLRGLPVRLRQRRACAPWSMPQARDHRRLCRVCRGERACASPTSSTPTSTPTIAPAAGRWRSASARHMHCTNPPRSRFPSSRSTTARKSSSAIRAVEGRSHARPQRRQRLPSRHRPPPRPRSVVRPDRRHAVRRLGRPARPSRPRPRRSPRKLYDSIHEKLMTLPDDIEIYPGHFSGSLCGAGMSGKPSSTIAFEKRWNAMLVEEPRASSSRPWPTYREKPADMEAILRANRGAPELGGVNGAGHPARPHARTSPSSRCWFSSTPSSARWSAWSAASCRPSPSRISISSRASAMLSFIVVFGVTKALSNYLAGRLSDRFGRKHILVAGWLVAVPVPFLLMWAPSWNWVLVANALPRREPGSDVVDDGDHEDRPRRPEETAAWRWASTSSPATPRSRRAPGDRLDRRALRAATRAVLSRRRVRRDRACACRSSSCARRSHHVAHEASLRASAGADLPTSARSSGGRRFTDRNLSSISQAGLVNNLNDGMAWGIFPLFFAAAGMSLDADRRARRALSGDAGGSPSSSPARWSDRIGRKWLIAAGMWVQAAAIALVIVAGGYGGFAAGAVLLGLGTAMVYPTLLAAIGDVAHPVVARLGGRRLSVLARPRLRDRRARRRRCRGPMSRPRRRDVAGRRP